MSSSPESRTPYDAHVVRMVYKNYRGETAVRTVVPSRIWFGSTEWHPEPQWLLDAHDLDRNEMRSFALCDVQAWEPTPVEDRNGAE